MYSKAYKIISFVEEIDIFLTKIHNILEGTPFKLLFNGFEGKKRAAVDCFSSS